MGILNRLFGAKKTKTATLVFNKHNSIIISEETIYIGRADDVLDINKDPNLDTLITKKGNEIRIKRHTITQGISRKHALLTKEKDGTYSIIDQGSKKGTFVNAIKVVPGKRVNLKNKDRVDLSGIGDHSLITFQILY